MSYCTCVAWPDKYVSFNTFQWDPFVFKLDIKISFLKDESDAFF